MGKISAQPREESPVRQPKNLPTSWTRSSPKEAIQIGSSSTFRIYVLFICSTQSIRLPAPTVCAHEWRKGLVLHALVREPKASP